MPMLLKILPSNNRMQPDFGKLRLPQPLMRSVMRCEINLSIE